MQQIRENCGEACREVLRQFKDAVACGAVDLGRGRLVTLQHSMGSFPREGIRIMGEAVVEMFQGAKLRRMQSLLATGMDVDSVSYPNEVFLATESANFFLKSLPAIDIVIVMVTVAGASSGQGWLSLRGAVKEIARAANVAAQPPSEGEKRMGKLLEKEQNEIGGAPLTPLPRASARRPSVEDILGDTGGEPDRARALSSAPVKSRSQSGRFNFRPRNRTQSIRVGGMFKNIDELAGAGSLEPRKPLPADDDPSVRMMNLLEKETARTSGKQEAVPAARKTGRHVLLKTGQLLKAARLAAGFSVREVANRLRIEKGDWDRWERGQRPVPARVKTQIIRLMPHAAEFL